MYNEFKLWEQATMYTYLPFTSAMISCLSEIDDMNAALLC